MSKTLAQVCKRSFKRQTLARAHNHIHVCIGLFTSSIYIPVAFHCLFYHADSSALSTTDAKKSHLTGRDKRWWRRGRFGKTVYTLLVIHTCKNIYSGFFCNAFRTQPTCIISEGLLTLFTTRFSTSRNF